MEKHKIRIVQGEDGTAEKIFIDNLELKGVCRYEIQNSENVYDEFENKMILIIEFGETQLLEIVRD